MIHKAISIRRTTMDNKKFEQLIDLIINENEERASELFHEIVVEKSRQIYENIMDEEMMGMEEDMDEDMMEDDMDEGMGGQVGDLLDEINAEESGMTEGEDDAGTFDLTHGDDEGHEEEELEDRVVKVEDKLDELMAEFEEIMGEKHDEKDAEFDDEAEEAGHDMTHDMEKDHDEEDDEEGDEEDMDDEEEEDESVMENINLPRVPAPKHGDDGAQKKSTVAANSGQRGMASKPVKFSGHAETVPTSPKKPHDAYTKGEGNLPGAGSFKNTPGKNNFTEKGSSTPKPVTKDGATGKRSPVAK